MNFSISHLILVFLILMLLFGAQRLEGIGTSLGKAVRGFKKGLAGEDLDSEKSQSEASEKLAATKRLSDSDKS